MFLFIFSLFFSGCFERAEEKVMAIHPNGYKKTSFWTYPDGEILKRNEWYSNGIKELEIPYKRNEPHGKFKRWTAFGNVAGVGIYKKGKKEGKWETFFDNDKIETRKYYKNDLKTGTWEAFHYNRNKAWVKYYKNDSAIGKWEKWYANGNLEEETSCHLGEPVGKKVRYYADGKPQWLLTCRFGVKDGLGEQYYPSGLLQLKYYYKNGQLEGSLETYRANGKISKREFWKQDVRDSLWSWFDSTGTEVLQSLFKKGTGTAYGLCPPGVKELVCAESTFVNNKLDGALYYYKENRQLRFEEVWRGGEIRESRSHYPDTLGGRLASEGFWKNGKRDGFWRNWYGSGILMDSLHYLNGERYGHQFSYDSTGKLYMHKEVFGKNRPVIMHLLNDK